MKVQSKNFWLIGGVVMYGKLFDYKLDDSSLLVSELKGGETKTRLPVTLKCSKSKMCRARTLKLPQPV